MVKARGAFSAVTDEAAQEVWRSSEAGRRCAVLAVRLEDVPGVADERGHQEVVEIVGVVIHFVDDVPAVHHLTRRAQDVELRHVEAHHDSREHHSQDRDLHPVNAAREVPSDMEYHERKVDRGQERTGANNVEHQAGTRHAAQ